MSALITLLLIFLVLVLFVFPIWAFIKINQNADEIKRLRDRIEDGEFRRGQAPAPSVTAPPPILPAAIPSSPPKPAETTPPTRAAPAWVPSGLEPIMPPPAEPAILPPIKPGPIVPAEPIRPAGPPRAAEPHWRPAINWEQFMGVKLFAWLGGLALFLGVAFFIKYSFEHDLIPAEVRMALGFLLGIGLVTGGVLLSAKRYRVTAQTLCASGIVSLYAVAFACRSIYHFAFFGPLATFALMALITVAAFFLAVRMEACVVAVLGMLGGFLTPVLLSTGQDNPLGLFTYLALLDAGLIAVALHRRWHFLVPLGAIGTGVMQVGWALHFLNDAKTLTAMAVCLGFDALFLSGFVAARKLRQISTPLRLPVGGLALLSFLFAGYFALATPTGLEPVRLFAFVFLVDLCVLALAALDDASATLHAGAGGAVFAILAAWTIERLNNDLLPAVLGFYFLFAVVHSAFPLWLQRRKAGAPPAWWGQVFPPLALLLVLGPVLNSPVVSMLIWPAVLLIDLLAIVLAWLSRLLIALAAVLMLTLITAGAWIFKIPAGFTGVPSLLLVIGGFAILFFAAGLWLLRKFSVGRDAPEGLFGLPGDPRAHLPGLSVLLPFVLLIMAVARLQLANPTPIFGLALLLIVLAFGLTRMLVLEWVPACALAGTVAFAYAWQENHFSPAMAGLTFGWYLFFHLAFTLFPFVFRRSLAETRGPWIAAAASGPLFFPLVYELVRAAWPNNVMGLLAVGFALPALAGLAAVLRLDPPQHPRRLGRLALFGGVALLFITLIFPIQFDRQWITLGWALEGAALLWLFHRVPHRGLPLAGVGLLIAAFVRLAFNPAVLSYHPHGALPILNWYLYTYGLAAACLLAGARLLAPPRDRVLETPAPPLLNGLGIALLFLLMNIEIADFFSPAQAALTFEFSGNFARDMSYTIGWALFAFGLLMLGIWKKSAAARYSALGLLGAALLKLFFHDLAHLSQLYRIGALFAVAIIAILASFVYQRFLPANEKTAAKP